MKTNEHADDICIGQDQWIKAIDFDFKTAPMADLDPMLDEIIEFLKTMETECVAGCCGLDAFDFWPDGIKKAAESFDRSILERAIRDLACKIRALEPEILGSKTLNVYLHKSVFLDLLDHILKCL